MLNFKEGLRQSTVRLDFSSDSLSRIEISSDLEGYGCFVKSLNEIEADSIFKELKWALTGELTLFVKKRADGESKALIAHPEEKEWVGTLALSPEDFQLFKNSLEKAQSFWLGDIVRLGRASNLNIKFSVMPDA